MYADLLRALFVDEKEGEYSTYLCVGMGKLVRLIDGARIGVLNYVALMCRR